MFSEYFAFQESALVNLVGGGGKTGLILKLMEEYCHKGSVLYTTTTRIHPPDTSKGLVIISSNHVQSLKSLVERICHDSPDRSFKLVVTQLAMSPNLLRGVTADFCQTLDRNLFSIILNEADGAASMSLKMPRDYEPVLMENADYLVPVIGIDCLQKPIGPEVFFHWETMAARFSIQAGQMLAPQLAADILMHKEGVCKDWKPGMEIIPFINKVDDPAQDPLAKDLALAIIKNSNYPVRNIVWGSLCQDRVTSLSAHMP